MSQRVVFDTTTVVSALLFSNGRLAWLRPHWRNGSCRPLIAQVTAAELTRVLAYPKFRLTSEDRRELLAEYLPFCERIEPTENCPVQCGDKHDQTFLDLAQSGNAHFLVTGDKKLLELTVQTTFVIETPEAYRARVPE